MSKEISLQKEEYESILKQAVEQIRTTRIIVAKQLNSAAQSIYWNLGKLILKNNWPKATVVPWSINFRLTSKRISRYGLIAPQFVEHETVL
jgi:hypothetical protein